VKKELTGRDSGMKLMREGTDGKGQITFLADVPFHAQFNRAISVKGVCMIALLAI